MFNGIFFNQNKEELAKRLADFIRISFNFITTEEIESEVIEHSSDITLSREKKNFIFKEVFPAILCSFKISFENNVLELWVCINRGMLNQLYVSKLIYIYEIPFLYNVLSIDASKGHFRFINENSNVETILNNNEILIDLLNKYFITKVKLGGYEIRLSANLETTNEFGKTYLMLSNLPYFNSKQGLCFHENTTIKLINLIIDSMQ